MEAPHVTAPAQPRLSWVRGWRCPAGTGAVGGSSAAARARRAAPRRSVSPVARAEEHGGDSLGVAGSRGAGEGPAGKPRVTLERMRKTVRAS